MKKGLLQKVSNLFGRVTNKKTVMDRQLERLQLTILKDYDCQIYAINAFFTALIDYEHSGKDLKLVNLHRNVDAALLYFGSSYEDQIQNIGVQTKAIYPLTEFITKNQLWAKITKTRKFHFRKKYVSDKTFNDVVAAINKAQDPEIIKLFNMYPFDFFAIAYTAVAEVGHERLLKLQPWNAGQVAIKIIREARGLKEPNKNILLRVINIFYRLILKSIKYLLRFAVVVSVLYFVYWLLVSGNAMFLFD